MKFNRNRTYKNLVDDAFEALQFLRDAYENNRLNEIENMDDVLDALDISGDLEYALQRLKDFHIE